MLAWRLLWRNWRSGEVKILAAALVLAVAVVTAIAVFVSRMEQSLERQSNSFLAADRVVASRFSMPEAWLSKPAEFQLSQAQAISFSSMVFAAEEMHLASVKAVSQHYPLRGSLEVSHQPFAVAGDVELADTVPGLGEAWVDSRLLPLMNLQLGDALLVGEREFTISRIVIREPDESNGFSIMGPRVLINVDDLAATGVIQPGSRVSYRWLLAGEEADLKRFEAWLTPQLGEHYQLQAVRDAQRNISTALERGSRFLLLAGMIAVLLASVAIAIAAQQFADRHVDQVALMKSFGASASKVRWLYVSQLLLLAALASVVAVALGESLQQVIALSIASLVKVELINASFWAYGTGVMTGFVCLLLFALPPLWHLPEVSPLKVLRRELETSQLASWARGLLGLLAVVLLVWFYSGSVLLTSVVVMGLLVVVMLAAALALLLLRGGRHLGARAGNLWRLALASLERRRGQSVTQIIVFACAVMLLMVLFSIRSSLIDEWRMQLPDDVANHFVVNIAPHEIAPIQSLFEVEKINTNHFYPMVLGRIVALNGITISEDQREKVNALRRELNLSWADELAADNKILQGQWWDGWESQQGLPGVSIEQALAEEIGLALGDRLGFTLGGLPLEAEVASIRSLDWNSMRPNFYVLFSPGALDGFSPNYMTSLHIPVQKKSLINRLLKSYPTIVVIEADRIIERIRSIVNQISQVVELVLWLVLVAGILVLAAAVNASMQTRIQEAGILRALGSGKKLILGSLWLEFSVMGLVAGLLAVVGGEMLLMGLQSRVFEQAISPHYGLWLVVPLLSVLMIGGLGLLACRKVVLVSPGLVLREFER